MDQDIDQDITRSKTPYAVHISPPPPDKRAQRNATFVGESEKKTRYALPDALESSSPVGYRTRVSLDDDDITQAMALLSMERPTGFGPQTPVTEQELFEEASLGVLVARQSTNFRGHRQVTFGPEDSERLAHLLRSLKHRDADVLDGATYTHVVLSRPYRTLFTLLLTFIGHPAWTSMVTVLRRALLKRFKHIDDIPTIGYLRELHIGILADAMERAAAIVSAGTRRAQVHSAPFCSEARRLDNKPVLHAIEEMCGVTRAMRSQGWRVALVTQVGTALEDERLDLKPETCRKLGANLMALRSERILPGANQEPKAPPQYHIDQQMDVPEELTVMAGRAAYNAFAHWAGCDRERAKELLMLERIDVLTPKGAKRIASIRDMLLNVNDMVLRDFPTWANLLSGGAFKRNARTGAKAFGLAGQRVYIGGLSRDEIRREGIDWDQAVRAVGACASRSALLVEWMGCTNLPDDCDLLAGICLMAGPVNQNDIGKAFYGQSDLLTEQFGPRDPTSLLVWTLKAKTVADPVGNEEQLMNAARKGLLVDLRPGPHDVVSIRQGRKLTPMRKMGAEINRERAFADVGNFVTDPEGRDIPGNRGTL
ncbi:MAG: hypothetical protein AAFX99_31615, partial [Myxococcota bacterium]